MKHERKFRNHEDDWYQERRDRERKKPRGKRREANVYDDYIGDDLGEDVLEEPITKPAKPQSTTFQYNESTTIEVKNYKIDLSRVKAISKEETIYNGRKSYGIRFDFMGKNGYGRDVWYGTNSGQRDEEYTKYLAIWNSIPKAN